MASFDTRFTKYLATGDYAPAMDANPGTVIVPSKVESSMTTEEVVAQDAAEKYLAMDAAFVAGRPAHRLSAWGEIHYPGKQKTLAEHDRRFHPNGYAKGMRCDFRKRLDAGDFADADLAEAERIEAERTGVTTPDSSVGKWMAREYPRERKFMGDFDREVTFREVLNRMLGGEDFYDILKCTESVERELVFQKMSEMFDLPYSAFYDLWLHGPDSEDFRREHGSSVEAAVAQDAAFVDGKVAHGLTEYGSAMHPGGKMPKSLAEHDKMHHPKGYKKGDKCKYRENLEKNDEADNLSASAGESSSTENKKLKIPQEDFDAIQEIRGRIEPLAKMLDAGHDAMTEAGLSVFHNTNRLHQLMEKADPKTYDKLMLYPLRYGVDDSKRLGELLKKYDGDVMSALHANLVDMDIAVKTMLNGPREFWTSNPGRVPSEKDITASASGDSQKS